MMPKLTPKQMGDACEMLVASELTLAGVPTMKAPDQWRGYDLMADPPSRLPQKISVKGRTFKRGAAFVDFSVQDDFDWLAVVILPAGICLQRKIFIVPGDLAKEGARKYVASKLPNLREYRIDEVANRFSVYQNNFLLSLSGRHPAASASASDPAAV